MFSVGLNPSVILPGNIWILDTCQNLAISFQHAEFLCRLQDKILHVMVGDNPTQPALQNARVTGHERLENQTNHLIT